MRPRVGSCGHLNLVVTHVLWPGPVFLFEFCTIPYLIKIFFCELVVRKRKDSSIGATPCDQNDTFKDVPESPLSCDFGCNCNCDFGSSDENLPRCCWERAVTAAGVYTVLDSARPKQDQRVVRVSIARAGSSGSHLCLRS